MEFVNKLKDVEKNYKTIYGMGMPGMPITDANIREKVNQDKLKPAKDRWWTPAREARIREYIGKGYFGFDCICLAKAIGWGWKGDFSKRLGGAKYLSNGVPDWGANHTNKMGIDRSTDFSKIEVGHYVWMDGHIGFYIGDGLAIEASPKWKNGVQVTAVHNIGRKAGYNGRTWTTHGKLTWVDYSDSASETKGDEGEIMLSRTLRHGDSGEDVKLVQEFLKARGYYTGPIDGKFGPGQGFLNAVKAFQKAEGLEVDGVIGPATRARIIEMMIEAPKPVGDPEKEKLLQDEVNKQKAELKKLQDELTYIRNECRKYEDYFRLQEEIRRGIELL